MRLQLIGTTFYGYLFMQSCHGSAGLRSTTFLQSGTTAEPSSIVVMEAGRRSSSFGQQVEYYSILYKYQ